MGRLTTWCFLIATEIVLTAKPNHLKIIFKNPLNDREWNKSVADFMFVSCINHRNVIGFRQQRSTKVKSNEIYRFYLPKQSQLISDNSASAGIG